MKNFCTIKVIAICLILSLFCLNNVWGSEPGKWHKYPFEQSKFDFSGDKLQEKWEDLHGDQQPFPSAENLKELVEENKAYKDMTKPFKGDYRKLAQKIQQAWRYYHRGDFEKAYELGHKYYPIGVYVSERARAIHNFYLLAQEEKASRFTKHMETVLKYLREDKEKLGHAPKNPNVYFGIAYIAARQAMLNSILSSLKHGTGGTITEFLDKTLEECPDHHEAMLVKAGFNAHTIEKVGSFIGGLTYDVSGEKAKELYEEVIEERPDLIIGWVEKADGLLSLDEEANREEAIKCLRKARSMQADDAFERLVKRRAKNMLKQLDALQTEQASK